jgi:hypothetical protein
MSTRISVGEQSTAYIPGAWFEVYKSKQASGRMSKFLLGDIKLPFRRGERSHQWEEEATKRKVAKVARDPLPLESVVAVALLGVSPAIVLG